MKQELAEYELIPEEWGGSTVFAPVSAKTGDGINQLLEMILLTSEILELKANPNRQARGLVIEAELDKGRGPVATVLVQKGTLHVATLFPPAHAMVKVRAMIDDKADAPRKQDLPHLWKSWAFPMFPMPARYSWHMRTTKRRELCGNLYRTE